MKHIFKYKNILFLGFLIFALFVGAGNIIFPPILGLQAGDKLWISAVGFIITAVGLPILTIIALTKSGGDIQQMMSPIGKHFGLLLSIIIYLAVGPLFAIPRTAMVSYEVGVFPLLNNEYSKVFSLLIYNIIYFSIIIYISIHPKFLLNNLGNILAPLKIIGLSILGITVIFCTSGKPIVSLYGKMAFTHGIINGYLTMDTLGAMVFGIIIIKTIRSFGVNDLTNLTKYAILSGLVSAILLIVVYSFLFKLGSNTGSLLPNATNGANVLHTYVKYIFGQYGVFFLGLLIFISCIVTAVGLISSCSEFFSFYLKISYHKLILIFGIFSAIISNLGLDKLISFSLPVLIIIYPPCIVLILMNFTIKFWKKPNIIIKIMMLISMLFSILSVMNEYKITKLLVPKFIKLVPLYQYNLSWILPTLFFVLLFAIYELVVNKIYNKINKRD